jgi:hypothetical protein
MGYHGPDPILSVSAVTVDDERTLLPQSRFLAPGTYTLNPDGSVTIGGMGGTSWGMIVGTLSDQLDLQAALDDRLTEAEADLLYDPLGEAASTMATHLAAADPHPQYLTAAEGDAAYQPLDSDLTQIAANITAQGHAIIDDATPAAQRTTIGLGNVDNTSDLNKPISTATQTALNLKQDLDATLTALAGLDATPGPCRTNGR